EMKYTALVAAATLLARIALAGEIICLPWGKATCSTEPVGKGECKPIRCKNYAVVKLCKCDGFAYCNNGCPFQ
ncbi:hypothetical protein E4U42_006933, partial [Claviceps africana]